MKEKSNATGLDNGANPRGCERAEELVAYLYGEAAPDEAKAFRRHLNACAVCREELAAFGAVREAVGEWRAEVLRTTPALDIKEALTPAVRAPRAPEQRNQRGLPVPHVPCAGRPIYQRGFEFDDHAFPDTSRRRRHCRPGGANAARAVADLVGTDRRRSLATGSGGFRFGFAAVEFAHNIGANRPRSDLRGLGLLAFAICLLVGRADEGAFDEHMGAFLDVSENGLSQARAKYRDAMPLDFRDPFVFCVFPRALRGDGKNGEF